MDHELHADFRPGRLRDGAPTTNVYARVAIPCPQSAGSFRTDCQHLAVGATYPARSPALSQETAGTAVVSSPRAGQLPSDVVWQNGPAGASQVPRAGPPGDQPMLTGASPSSCT